MPRTSSQYNLAVSSRRCCPEKGTTSETGQAPRWSKMPLIRAAADSIAANLASRRSPGDVLVMLPCVGFVRWYRPPGCRAPSPSNRGLGHGLGIRYCSLQESSLGGCEWLPCVCLVRWCRQSCRHRQNPANLCRQRRLGSKYPFLEGHWQYEVGPLPYVDFGRWCQLWRRFAPIAASLFL